jgi:dihydropteroate synthase
MVPKTGFLMNNPLIMGIVNATPDSFSDGGAYDPIDHARKLTRDGADILDIGGESTRPGAQAVSLEDELSRVIPVIEAIRAEWSGPISIDTLKPDIARAAVKAGATIWNDVSALRHTPQSLEVAAKLGVEVVLMHRQGTPQTMQAAPYYDEVVSEVEAFLLERAEMAIKAGVLRHKIWIDPGIGFGKTLSHNLSLIRATQRLGSHGLRLLVGASRKRFIGTLEDQQGWPESPSEQRLGGTLSTHLYAAMHGAQMLRVHDVREMKQALRVWQAINIAP